MISTFFSLSQVYYPVRHHLIQHVISSIQRLGFTTNATIEQKRLAVDLCEIVIKWESHRASEAEENSTDIAKMQLLQLNADRRRISSSSSSSSSGASAGAQGLTPQQLQIQQQQQQQQQALEAARPLDKTHCDSIVNFLLRLACQQVICAMLILYYLVFTSSLVYRSTTLRPARVLLRTSSSLAVA